MANSISVNVNGIQISEDLVTIDDFSYNNRIIHLVVGKNDLLNISKEQENPNDKMVFSFSPTQNDLSLSNVTANGQYRINLSWQPQNIQSGSWTTFMVDITDVFLLDRPVLVNYNLSILYEDKIIFQKNSTSTGLKTEQDIVEFLIPDNITGPIILQFENLGGSDLAMANLPVVVNRISVVETSIPEWIKKNAGWWADGHIDDSAFVSGLQWLIENDIMKIPPTEQGAGSDNVIPEWIKKNAGWWADGHIDDGSFVSGIQWLISNGIIVI
jgi:hypothetical protein